jgi:hypothetical protein
LQKHFYIIFALLMAVLVATVVTIAYSPPPRPAIVPVTLRGYTNNAAGQQLALFSVNNLGPTTVRREGHYQIQAQTSAGWTNFLDGYFAGSFLPAGATETIQVPTPTNQPVWRISFLVYPDAGKSQVVKMAVTGALISIGLKPHYRMIRCQVQSNWVVNEPAEKP